VRGVGPESVNYRAVGRLGSQSTEALWCLNGVQAKGDCRLREMERIGGGIVSRSGRAEVSECLCRCSGRCPGGQAEMSEDGSDHGGVFDGGDDFQCAAPQ